MYAIYLFREMCDLDPRASLDAAIHTRLGSSCMDHAPWSLSLRARRGTFQRFGLRAAARARAAESEMRRESVSEYTIVHFFSVIHWRETPHF